MKQLNRRAGGGQFIEGWENKGGERSSKLNGHIFQIKSIDGPKLVIIRLASPSHNWGTKPLIASVPMDVSMTKKNHLFGDNNVPKKLPKFPKISKI